MTAEYFHISRKFAGCVYGDKEYFEFGAFAAGEDYHIEKEKASAIGSIEYHSAKDKYYICSAQMGHADENNNLLWSNGGLMNCKANSAADDFKENPKYFKAKYGDVKTLEDHYSKPIDIQGFIIPDISKHNWIQYPECKRYVYCAFVADPPVDSNTGKLVRFSRKNRQIYEDIASVWFEGTKNV